MAFLIEAPLSNTIKLFPNFTSVSAQLRQSVCDVGGNTHFPLAPRDN